MNIIIKVVFIIFAFGYLGTAINNGLALTPPFIFIPQRSFCQTDQNYILEQIDKLQLSSFASAPFDYKCVVIEACWQSSRNKIGTIQQDYNRFPSPLPELINKIHSKGFCVGLTTDIGEKTSCGTPGSLGYQRMDINQYANWDIDYLYIKNSQKIADSKAKFAIMSQLILQTGKKIMISIDNSGIQGVQSWGNSVANTWTTFNNLQNNWNSLVLAMDRQIGLDKYARQGGWNLPGKILIDLPATLLMIQYGLWISLKSPIMLDYSIQKISPSQMSLFSNSELIQILKDEKRKQGKLIRRQQYSKGLQYVWGVQLGNNRYLVTFVNGFNQATQMNVFIRQQLNIKVSSYWLRDPLNKSTIGTSSSNTIFIRVQPKNIKMLVINY